MKLIHLSDLHLVAAPRLVYGLDPRERLSLAVADINAHHGDAAAVVITGDLADRGEPEAYAALKDLLQPLSVPVHLGIGNHDDRRAFQAAFPEVPRDLNGFCQAVFEIGAFRFLLLDSISDVGDAGRYCEARVAWLDGELRAAPETPTYLFVHHNPAPCGLAEEDRIMLLDEAALGTVLKRHPQVRHLAFGHVHRAYSGTWRGFAFASVPGLNHQTALDFEAAKQGSPGSHEPPAYGIMLIDQRGDVTYHYHQFLDTNLRYFYSDELNCAATYGAFVDLVENQRTEPG